MQVGDYVRTKKGFIGKANVITQYNVNIEDKKIVQLINIAKTSPNIIDLIEVGDYVNGERVDYIDDCKGAMREFYYAFEDVTHDVGHYEEEIETIVTKEQFEAMEYKVGVDKE